MGQGGVGRERDTDSGTGGGEWGGRGTLKIREKSFDDVRCTVVSRQRRPSHGSTTREVT